MQHKTFPCRRLPALIAVAIAWPAAAEPQLPTVEVSARKTPASLGLDQPSSTGSRTGLAARELPASVDSVDAAAIEERGDSRVREAITRTPGLTYTGSGGNGGLSFSSRGFNGTNSVGIAEDGVRLQTGAGTQNYPGDSWGYERIEVLRGPASVVYGSGTVGATINAIRKTPSRVAQFETLAGLGSNGALRAGVGAGGPLGDIASYRIDAYGTHSDGDRELGNSQGGKWMSMLRLQPAADLRFDLIADYSRQRPERYWGTPTDNGRVVASLRDKNYNAEDSIIRYEDKRFKARAEWRANEVLSLANELYYLEANRRWMNIENYRYNPANGTVARSDYLHIQHNLDQTGNRLEATLTGGGHNAVVGWETAWVNFRHTNNSPYRGASTVSADNPAHGLWFSLDPTLPKFDTSSRLNALYVEDAWRFAERWILLAGVRRDMADIKRSEWVAPGGGFSRTLNGNAYRLGLTWLASRDTSFYVQASQGHDPVTSLISLNLANADFKLTQGRQVEAGVKQKLADGLGEWTAAVYRIDKRDIITRDPNNAALSVQGGSQYTQGVELAGALAPWKNWRFEGNLTFLQARYSDFSERVGAAALSRSGNRPTNVPERAANLWAHYTQGDWQASLGGRYVGKRYANNANTLVLPSYFVADAALAWHVDKRATLRFFARNLADKVYATNSYNNQFTLGEPRRFELVGELKF